MIKQSINNDPRKGKLDENLKETDKQIKLNELKFAQYFFSIEA